MKMTNDLTFSSLVSIALNFRGLMLYRSKFASLSTSTNLSSASVAEACFKNGEQASDRNGMLAE